MIKINVLFFIAYVIFGWVFDFLRKLSTVLLLVKKSSIILRGWRLDGTLTNTGGDRLIELELFRISSFDERLLAIKETILI